MGILGCLEHAPLAAAALFYDGMQRSNRKRSAVSKDLRVATKSEDFHSDPHSLSEVSHELSHR